MWIVLFPVCAISEHQQTEKMDILEISAHTLLFILQGIFFNIISDYVLVIHTYVENYNKTNFECTSSLDYRLKSTWIVLCAR